MSKLLITTQIFENYAWDEDGVLGTGKPEHARQHHHQDQGFRFHFHHQFTTPVSQTMPSGS